MNNLLRIFLPLLLVMIAGCDPGMAIHEVPPTTSNKSQQAAAPVNIQITTTHQLIGERWYAPRITFINHSTSKIIVTDAELVTSVAVYPNERRPEAYPVEIPQDKTSVLETNFQLANDVKKTFQHVAEVRVHFRVGNREQVITKSVVAGPLDYNP